ncbi:hypothetical protein KK062_27090 [Fulvivirgaceae bacterium PWU5]|uniref:Uncharacterized protein n=1 Tax=Dawidia cretensis TaxID=2782350 RepID=A0AAP2E2L4_9BACT|nr:hypothetical protein [Dawidia cretensis]MBT1711938.1 hypothetical protein [Dawidia cretensis]
MHRPGIASVIGNTIFLNKTTIEEVEKYHKDTLKIAIEQANQEWNRIVGARNRLRDEEKNHRIHIENVSKRINFDD